jgi:hypothetical protein
MFQQLTLWPRPGNLRRLRLEFQSEIPSATARRLDRRNTGRRVLARPLQAESEYHAITWAFDFGGVLHRPFHRPSCSKLATRDSTIVAENPIWLRPLLAISNAPVTVLATDGMEAPSEPIENFWVVSVIAPTDAQGRRQLPHLH